MGLQGLNRFRQRHAGRGLGQRVLLFLLLFRGQGGAQDLALEVRVFQFLQHFFRLELAQQYEQGRGVIGNGFAQ